MPKKKAPRYYARVRWAPEDVKSLRPGWSLKKCEAELSKTESLLEDRLTELGFEVLNGLLPWEKH